MPRTTATVAAKQGLHARSAARFTKRVAQAGVPVTIASGGHEPVNAASMLAVIGLEVGCGDEVELQAQGSGASAVLAELKALLESPTPNE